MYNIFTIFNKKDKSDLAKMVDAGLITEEEKLRIEAERTDNKLKEYLNKKKRKGFCVSCA